MKEIVISSIIIIIIVIGDIYTQNITSNSVEQMHEKLIEIKEIAKKENQEELNQEIESMEKEWLEIKKKLSFYVEHNEIEKVENEMTALKSYAESETYDECIVSIDKSNFLLEHVKEKGEFKLKNIF